MGPAYEINMTFVCAWIMLLARGGKSEISGSSPHYKLCYEWISEFEQKDLDLLVDF